MTRKSETHDRERLDPLGESSPGCREEVVYKNDSLGSRRLPLRWECLLFSGFLSFAPILPAHGVLGMLKRGAFETQAQVSSQAEATVTTQGRVATTEDPLFSVRTKSTALVQSEQTEAPTEEGTDTHGATDDDGDDDEDDDGDDDDGAGLSTDAPLVEHAEINILRLSPEPILTL